MIRRGHCIQRDRRATRRNPSRRSALRSCCLSGPLNWVRYAVFKLLQRCRQESLGTGRCRIRIVHAQFIAAESGIHIPNAEKEPRHVPPPCRMHLRISLCRGRPPSGQWMNCRTRGWPALRRVPRCRSPCERATAMPVTWGRRLPEALRALPDLCNPGVDRRRDWRRWHRRWRPQPSRSPSAGTGHHRGAGTPAVGRRPIPSTCWWAISRTNRDIACRDRELQPRRMPHARPLAGRGGPPPPGATDRRCARSTCNGAASRPAGGRSYVDKILFLNDLERMVGSAVRKGPIGKGVAIARGSGRSQKTNDIEQVRSSLCSHRPWNLSCIRLSLDCPTKNKKRSLHGKGWIRGECLSTCQSMRNILSQQ